VTRIGRTLDEVERKLALDFCHCPGFSTSKVDVQLQTDQTVNVPISLGASTQSENVTVTTQQPVLNTAETRPELTLSNEAVDSPPDDRA